MLVYEDFAKGILCSLPSSSEKGLTGIFINFKQEYIQWALDTMNDTDNRPVRERKYRSVSINNVGSSSRLNSILQNKR